jgi:hypothetical protein
MMDHDTLTDARRQSVHLRHMADLRLLTIADGPAAGGRIVQARTPQGLLAEFALDRGGDLHALNWRGTEIGWHSAADGITPWPQPDAEEGLGFLRGFDGFLVTCGLDHHGIPGTSPADDFRYPLRKRNHHPLHGRIATCRAEIIEKAVDWEKGEMRLRLLVRQATVFGEVLELDRTWTMRLDHPRINLTDRVTNRGFRPARHGILYHMNLGAPFLGPELAVDAPDWAPASVVAADRPTPQDDHVEIVTSAPTPPGGRITLTNPVAQVALSLTVDPARLPETAMWRAWQSGVFALGIEPQTRIAIDPPLAPQASVSYSLNLALSDPSLQA